MQHAVYGKGLAEVARRLNTRLLGAFAAAALSLTALTSAAQAQGYQLRSGDVLRIEVLEDAGLSRSALIAPDGRFTLPLAGSVRASGRTVEQIQADLTARLSSNFASTPTVSVSIDRLGVPALAEQKAAKLEGIYVVGEAGRPGRLEVLPGTTVLQAFAQMGGFSKFAATKRIQLRRDGKIYPLNYKAIVAGTSDAGNTTLKEGDVLVVPQRGLFE